MILVRKGKETTSKDIECNDTLYIDLVLMHLQLEVTTRMLEHLPPNTPANQGLR